MKTATQRIFTDSETGFKCRLYTSNDASKYHLIYEGQNEKIADGSEVNGFYISAHTNRQGYITHFYKIVIIYLITIWFWVG